MLVQYIFTSSRRVLFFLLKDKYFLLSELAAVYSRACLCTFLSLGVSCLIFLIRFRIAKTFFFFASFGRFLFVHCFQKAQQIERTKVSQIVLLKSCQRKMKQQTQENEKKKQSKKTVKRNYIKLSFMKSQFCFCVCVVLFSFYFTFFFCLFLIAKYCACHSFGCVQRVKNEEVIGKKIQRESETKRNRRKNWTFYGLGQSNNNYYSVKYVKNVLVENKRKI